VFTVYSLSKMKLSDSSKEVLALKQKDAESRADVDVNKDDGSRSSGIPDGSSANNDSTSDANSNRTSGTDDEMQMMKDTLTKKETAQVFRLRVIVLLILLAAATSISWAVFYIIRSGETEQFEVEFYSVAEKIIDKMQEVMVEISAVSGLAVIATADAEDRGQEWPFVTLNAFQEKAKNARDLSGAIYISLNPIVQSDQLVDWEKFVLGGNNSWM
jgi:hypothetical protein